MDTDTTSSRPLSQNDNGPCVGAAESDEEIVTPYRWLISDSLPLSRQSPELAAGTNVLSDSLRGKA